MGLWIRPYSQHSNTPALHPASPHPGFQPLPFLMPYHAVEIIEHKLELSTEICRNMHIIHVRL